ncbi:MAG: SIS domain-containing protein [Actinobacteria bacterium]|nr:SIS domain-containing protein [Actinomycetota bacterium]
MEREMAEQPQVLGHLAARAEEDEERIRAVLPEPLTGTTFIARGSSDNAAVVGRYMAELAAGRPASLAAPSLHTLYGATTAFDGHLAIALSQSGATPEINLVLRRIGEGGAVKLAVTNDADSLLAEQADCVYDLAAGPELAVPATKTVTAQLFAMGVLARALGPAPSHQGLAELPEAIAGLLEDREPARALALRWQGAKRMIVAARGIGLGIALEGALKVEELTGIQATAFSAADLRHGPIAVVQPETPVLLLDLGGPANEDLAELATEIAARGGSLATCGSGPAATLSVPPLEELAAGIAATVRLQQLALELSLLAGLDPDRPFGLSKVTLTW